MIRMLTVLLVLAAATAAQAQTQDRRASHCIAIADAAPGSTYLHRAAYRPAAPALPQGARPAAFRDPLPDNTVRISYITHASFMIETPGGLTAVTDFTGYIGSTTLIPDVVTMNHAHSTHWTANPDPAIPHALEGWSSEYGRPADIHLDLGEMLVRNVATDIRSGFRGGEPNGNSIFIFEVAGLCIGHLGHLHHEPSPQEYAAIGRLDVVMAAVDGGLTVDLPTMIRILKRLKSSVVIPMHWFSPMTLETFAAGMADAFAIERPGGNWVEVSLRTLPDRPTVMLLQPVWLSDPE